MIGGGTALSALGLRRTGDIDLFGDTPNVDFSTADVYFHSPEGDRFPVKISRASVDFPYHFVLYGRPFASSRFMFRYKFLRREFPKDFVDIALLSLHFLRFTNLISGETSQNFVAFLIRRRKTWMPVKRFADRVYLLLVNGQRKVVSIRRNFSN